MLGFFCATFLLTYNFVISPTDLKAIVTREDVSYPLSLSNSLEKTLNKLSEVKNDSISHEYVGIYNYLVKTTTIKTIVLHNETDKTLKGIKFKHLNTDAITAYSISADYLVDEEESKLFNSVKFDKDRSIVYLKDLLAIPPKSKVTIKLWGDFPRTLLADNDINITYDGGDAYFEKTYEVSGTKGYFAHYSFEIIFLMFCIFIIVYYFGIRYAINNP